MYFLGLIGARRERERGSCEGLKDLVCLKLPTVSGVSGWGVLTGSGQTAPGFISLLFVCQRRDILHYANDFLWRKSFIAFSIFVLDGLTGCKKLVIILEKYSVLLSGEHLKPETSRAGDILISGAESGVLMLRKLLE